MFLMDCQSGWAMRGDWHSDVYPIRRLLSGNAVKHHLHCFEIRQLSVSSSANNTAFVDVFLNST